MLGNVAEWVEDCYVADLRELPKDGSAAAEENCASGAIRGGSWGFNPRNLRAAFRYGGEPDFRGSLGGFRLARTIPP